MHRYFLNSLMTVVILVSGFLGIINHVSASNDCLSFDLSAARTDAELKQLLAICDAESAQTQSELQTQKKKSSSLASDVSLLDSLIKKAAQQIQIKNQIISQLGTQINQKQRTIETLSQKLSRENDSLGQILRKKNEIDNTTLTEMMLSNYRISNFFLDIDNFESVNKALQDSVNKIKGVRTETTVQKTTLEQKKLEQANLKIQIEQEKKQTQVQQNDKKQLLASSKVQEQSYQKLLDQKKAQAAKISAQLFKFKGQKGIPFGDAYRFAKEASQATGVRPAFILAILKQESNYGKYDGGCVLVDIEGTGKKLSNGELIPNVMKPSRDLKPFIEIVKDLGLNPFEQQFSCPITAKVNGKYADYGGAMGPSQFIPSTWNMYKSRIEDALTIPHANPWNPEHAITATALFMKDLGAQDTSQERNAACKYYSGRSCSSSSSFYGNSVIKLMVQIQSDIDIINAAN